MLKREMSHKRRRENPRYNIIESKDDDESHDEDDLHDVYEEDDLKTIDYYDDRSFQRKAQEKRECDGKSTYTFSERKEQKRQKIRQLLMVHFQCAYYDEHCEYANQSINTYIIFSKYKDFAACLREYIKSRSDDFISPADDIPFLIELYILNESDEICSLHGISSTHHVSGLTWILGPHIDLQRYITLIYKKSSAGSSSSLAIPEEVYDEINNNEWEYDDVINKEYKWYETKKYSRKFKVHPVLDGKKLHTDIRHSYVDQSGFDGTDIIKIGKNTEVRIGVPFDAILADLDDSI
jgi:hypothetical protein